VRNWEVRFALNNGHRQPDLSGPKSAQFRTHAPHKNRSMFDHRVGAGARRFIRATPPSEDPQSPAARLIARPKRSIQIL
jgi:hypothetical protein